jgi:hypothetical protein
MRKILFAGLLLFVATISNALNLGEIRKEIRYGIVDTTDTVNSPRWSDSILNEFIDVAQKRIAMFTDCCYGRWTINPSTGIQEYSKPTDMYKIDMVRYMQTSSTYSYRRVDFKDFAALDRDINTSWMNVSSGTPQFYYERGAYIGLYQKPSLSYSWTNALMIEGWKVPATMDDDSDIPWDADYSLTGFHFMIILDVVAKVKECEGTSAADKKSEFWAMIDYFRRWVKSRPDRTAVINFDFGK